MERKRKKVVSLLMFGIALICAAVIVGISLIRTSLVVNQNQAVNDLLADNNRLTTNQIIVKACELLGTKYHFGSKGTTGDPYGSAGVPLNVDTVKNNGIDCTGLIYWTLSSLGQGTQGFGFNNPVPVDTYHWLQYWNGSTRVYWKECTNAARGTKSVYDADLTINGNKIEVLKANDEIGDLRYYEYGQKGQYLPAGTIIISNAKALAGRTLSDGTVVKEKEVEDHAWITLGYLDTTNPDEVIDYLVSMGVPRDSLIAGVKQEDGTISPSNANVVKESDSCKYWRIEATASNDYKGVYINNMDAELGVSRYNVSQGKYIKKAVGPIWAFRLTEEVKGDYTFNINKVDENGTSLPLNSDTFRIYRNDQLLTDADYTISDNKIIITKDLTKVFEGAKDHFKVEENVAPEGFVKYEKTMEFDITTEYNAALGKKVGVVDPNTFYINETKQNFVNGEYQFDGGKIHLNDVDASGNKTGVVTLNVKNTRLAGHYDLNIYKTDASGKEMNGAKFTVKSISNDINNNFVGEWKTQQLIENESTFKLSEGVIIKSVDDKDVFEITETQIPNGYIGLNKKIVLQVEKEIRDSKYVMSKVKVYAIDSNEEVNGTILSNDTNLIGTADNFGTITDRKVSYDVEGKTFTVELPESNNGVNTVVKVFVQNKYVDLALKKTITKVEDTPVSVANTFNTGRTLSELGDVVNGLTEDGVDLIPLDTSTNASYYMNKKPVEVAVGEKIEYSIKIFNEGEVKARASKIADYIPNGLKVIGVKYAGEDLIADTDYTYDEAKGLLQIDLTQKGQLINAYANGRISKDEVIVICEVKANATGILTNVAEILEYMDESGVIDEDIDSVPEDWNAPGNENKLENTKDSTPWRNYNANSTANDWSFDYLAQDKGVNGNKGDDDDFDKVVVIGEKTYTLTIKKVNAETQESINDVLFNITKSLYNNSTTPVTETRDNVAFEDEKIVDGVSVNKLRSARVVYSFNEVPDANNKYIQLDGTLRVEMYINPGKISSYNLYYKPQGSEHYTSITKSGVFSRDYETKVKASNGKEFTIKFVLTEDNLDVIIPNQLIEKSQYGLRLRKISSGDGSPLVGVKFSGTENNNPLAFESTDANGYTNQITRDITVDNYATDDAFAINEIDLGTNTSYTKLQKTINVNVSKELTLDGKLKYKEFEVTIDNQSVKLTNSNKSGNINITDNGIRYTVNATLETINGVETVTITVPNAPDNTVEIRLLKQNKNDNSPVGGARFSIYRYGTNDLVYRGESVGTAEGIVIQDKVEAGTQTLNYEIHEDYPATGYVNTLSDKVLKLTIKETNGNVEEASIVVLNKDENRTEVTGQDLATVTEADGKAIVIIKNPVVIKDVDLALKKVITKVDGHEVKASSPKIFDEIYERTTDGKMRIDTTPLKNGGHDAEYYLNKTPILVLRGSKITYEIRIYNEGEEDATAGEIVDFLPNNMEFNRVLYKGQELREGTDYTYNENTNTLRIKVLANKDLIPHYDATEDVLYSETVIVECTVKDSAPSNYNLTNISEITKYIINDGEERSDKGKDIDSEAGNWSYYVAGDYGHNRVTTEEAEAYDRGFLNWANYQGLLVGDRRNEIEEGQFKNYLGEEDDDDFEKVKVVEIDLALKKIITQVGDKTEENFGEGFTRFQDVDGEREVKTDVRGLTRLNNITNAEYYLNKTPITVAIGDTISYQIRIYNEGSINATASEIKDYIPKGLKFESIYSSDGTELTSGFSYNQATNVLTITALKDNLIGYYKGNAFEYGQLPPEYNYVTVKCKVTGATTGVLTNVAEISEYQTDYGVTTVDVDSQTTGEGEWHAPEGTNKDTLDGKSGKDWADYYDAVEEGEFNNYPGQQDDDDFEKILVIGYKFKVKKVSDWRPNGLQGATFKINGQEYVTDENGEIDFGWIGINSDNQVAGEFTIEEVSAPGYVEIEKSVTLRLMQSLVNGRTDLSAYNLVIGDAEPYDNQLTGTKRHLAWINAVKGQYVLLDIVKDENGCYEIQIELNNKHKDLSYELYIKKVDSLETKQGISGSKFGVTPMKLVTSPDAPFWRYGLEKSFETREDGLTKVANTSLNVFDFKLKDTDKLYDIYKIKETETPYNYFRIADDQEIYLTVNKKAIKDDDGNYTDIKVESIQLTLNKGTENEVSTEVGNKVTLKNVRLEKQIKTVDITAELIEVTNDETGEIIPAIIVTVPNTKKEFDLSLRKHIIEDKEKFGVNRWSMPLVNAEGILNGSATTAIYNNAKEPAIGVEKNDIVRYGIRVYNEGELGGYAEVVKDDVPEGLEMIAPLYDENGLPLNTNAMYRWVMLDKDENETNDVTKAAYIVTDFLSKANGESLIPEGVAQENPFYMIPFDTNTMTTPVSREVQVEFKVKDTNKEGDVIINKAQISKHSDEFGNTDEDGLVDRDSTPNVWEDSPRDDDQDTEKLVVLRDRVYDLALRKFITKVNGEEVANSREPQVDCRNLVAGGHDADYYHTKEPVLVNQNDIVDYTLRIYNEGKDDAYAETIYDDVPADTEFVQPLYDDNGKPLNLNAEYGWRMYRIATEEELKEFENAESKNILVYDDVTYVPTEKAEEAVLVATDYLSMGNGTEKNLLKAFNPAIGQMTVENYRDIKLQFKVKEQKTITEEKIIINYAQIAKMLGGGGIPVTDIDSTPGKWIDGDDDQDIEQLKLGKFDLALYKWVSTAIVTENGKTTEYESGHNQADKSNLVNVSIPKNSLNKVSVKFKYQVKVENQGTIPGKALEVTDHIPAGLKFVAEDNTEFGWVAVDDKTVVTDYLKDTELKPGESAEVTIVLTWINGSENFGTKVNYAEISKDYNDYGWPDIDSTPNNFTGKPQEDDEDEDEVKLTIRTGMQNVVYIAIGIAVMAIIAGGVVGIKKFVVNK